MELKEYLKQFRNIAWCPTDSADVQAMSYLSYKGLRKYNISRTDVPDCFIFTDHNAFLGRCSNDCDNNPRFLSELGSSIDEFTISIRGLATLLNVKELERLEIGFDNEMVQRRNEVYYGKVFTADVLIEHPDLGKIITKFVYVVAESIKFAFDFLLKNNISVSYMIYTIYDYDGFSNGYYMFSILKDLNVKYLVTKNLEPNGYGEDIADKYLTTTQSRIVPLMRKIGNMTDGFYDWIQRDGSIFLYEVVDYQIKSDVSFFPSKYERYMIIE